MERNGYRPEKQGHPGLTALLVVLVMSGIAALLMSKSLFVVRTIQVEGAKTVSVQDVIVQSGLRQGESVFTIDREKLSRNINAHKLLYFESMDIRFPSTVILHVREREACAQIEYLGFMYAIDETGRVLSKSADLDAETSLPLIEGASIVSLIEGGDARFVEDNQMKNAQDLLMALETANLLLRTDVLNVSDAENLYIMTREGCKIELGDASKLDVKLAIAQAILRDQGDSNLSNAKIDVATGEDGFFIP